MLLINLVVITSCAPNKNLNKILSDSSCEPPCWLGMTPGVTSIEEVRHQLNEFSEALDLEKVFDYGAGNGYPVVIGWQTENQKIEGELYCGQETLHHMTIYGKMSLDDGIQLYGPPEKIYYDTALCAKQFIGLTVCDRVYLHYPEKGLILSYESSGYKEITIAPKEQIDTVYFYVPETQEHLEVYSKPFNEKNYLDWPGYTEIDIQE